MEKSFPAFYDIRVFVERKEVEDRLEYEKNMVIKYNVIIGKVSIVESNLKVSSDNLELNYLLTCLFYYG